MTRLELVAAFEQNDQLAIRRLGWWDVWDALATWWPAPNPPATAKTLVPYAKLLSDEIPDQILDALRELAGRWRPSPAEVKGHLNAKRRDQGRLDVGRGCDRGGTLEATAAAADAVHAGETGCGCPARPSTWRLDDRGVARCPRCHGIDWRQVYAAEDAGLIDQPTTEEAA